MTEDARSRSAWDRSRLARPVSLFAFAAALAFVALTATQGPRIAGAVHGPAPGDLAVAISLSDDSAAPARPAALFEGGR